MFSSIAGFSTVRALFAPTAFVWAFLTIAAFPFPVPLLPCFLPAARAGAFLARSFSFVFLVSASTPWTFTPLFFPVLSILLIFLGPPLFPLSFTPLVFGPLPIFMVLSVFLATTLSLTLCLPLFFFVFPLIPLLSTGAVTLALFPAATVPMFSGSVWCSGASSISVSLLLFIAVLSLPFFALPISFSLQFTVEAGAMFFSVMAATPWTILGSLGTGTFPRCPEYTNTNIKHSTYKTHYNPQDTLSNKREQASFWNSSTINCIQIKCRHHNITQSYMKDKIWYRQA